MFLLFRFFFNFFVFNKLSITLLVRFLVTMKFDYCIM